jgi:hypothetical protein
MFIGIRVVTVNTKIYLNEEANTASIK